MYVDHQSQSLRVVDSINDDGVFFCHGEMQRCNAESKMKVFWQNRNSTAFTTTVTVPVLIDLRPELVNAHTVTGDTCLHLASLTTPVWWTPGQVTESPRTLVQVLWLKYSFHGGEEQGRIQGLVFF